jgi:hypothetical protein
MMTVPRAFEHDIYAAIPQKIRKGLVIICQTF